MPSTETHLRVLRLFQANPHMTQRELADLLGVSVGKVNYCVKALLNKGLIKVQNFSQSSNKFGYAYMLTPSGVRAKARLTAEYLRIKVAEYDALKLEIQRLKVETAVHKRKEARQ